MEKEFIPLPFIVTVALGEATNSHAIDVKIRICCQKSGISDKLTCALKHDSVSPRCALNLVFGTKSVVKY